MSEIVFFLLVVACLLLLASLLIILSLRESKIKFLVGLIPVFIFFAIMLYYQWGGWTLWQAFIADNQRQMQAKNLLKDIHNPQILIKKLRRGLQESPDPKGWYLLGRLYLSQGYIQEANEAFAQAYRLKPNDDLININYAESLWELRNRQFDDEIRGLYKNVLKRNPLQPDSLAMLAMDAFLSHDNQLAVSYWKRLLKLTPPDSKEALQIRRAIAKAI